MDVDARFRDAVQHYWSARRKQSEKQIEGGKIDAGTRGAVTGGTQVGALEVLVADILLEAGLEQLDIKTRTALELPGYYRSEKKWDLIVVSKNPDSHGLRVRPAKQDRVCPITPLRG